MVLKYIKKFHLDFILANYSLFVINTLQKEIYLKDLVVKLLKEKNLSDYETLDSLFSEIMMELQEQKNPSKI